MEAVMWATELVWFRSHVAERDHRGGLCRSPVWMYASLHPAKLGPGGVVSNRTFVENISQLAVWCPLDACSICGRVDFHIFWHSTPSRVFSNAMLTPPPTGSDLGYR